MKITKTQKIAIFSIVAVLIGIAAAIISWILLCKPEIKEEAPFIGIG